MPITFNKKKVIYIGASEESIKWGSHDDPRKLLTPGEKYTVDETHRHTWHTKYKLIEFPDKFFNSVQFKDVPKMRERYQIENEMKHQRKLTKGEISYTQNIVYNTRIQLLSWVLGESDSF